MAKKNLSHLVKKQVKGKDGKMHTVWVKMPAAANQPEKKFEDMSSKEHRQAHKRHLESRDKEDAAAKVALDSKNEKDYTSSTRSAREHHDMAQKHKEAANAKAKKKK